MRRCIVALLSLVALAATVAGCGSSGSNGSTTEGGRNQVTVGVIPIVDVAPIYLGKQKGFFTKRKIDLKLQPGTGGAATVPAVVSGQFGFGFGNVTSLMVGRDKGLPLRVVTAGDSSTGQAGKDFSAVVVPKDSPIKSPADLAGKKVAVNNLNNIGDTTVRASVRKAGGDPTGVKFVELEFPDMPAAVAAHRVDAAWIVEPFLSQARSQGARVVAWNLVDAAPDLTIATYFTTEKMLQSQPDLVSRFKAAMDESLRYSQAHPDEVRKVLLTYTKIPAPVARQITLPKFPTQVNRGSLQTLGRLAQQDGLVKKPVDLNALLGSGS
jgi:NitT/TauT family transport system substrate-binding protein